ncbi:MAG: serine protease [Actinobacteria bacterium]|nr:serine protease [Actinomycetota bacterium]
MIGSRVVLTAAHCIDGRGAEQMNVVAGQVDLCEPTQSPAERIRVEAIHTHPAYRAPSKGSDLAVLILDRSTNALPVSMSTETEITGEQVIVRGWGRQGTDGSFPCQLTSLRTTVVERAGCARDLTMREEALPIDALCTMGGGQTCVGDSGGPVIAGEPGKPNTPRLVGIVSWGRSCAGGTPGINTNVAIHADWICRTIAGLDEDLPSACLESRRGFSAVSGGPMEGTGFPESAAEDGYADDRARSARETLRNHARR